MTEKADYIRALSNIKRLIEIRDNEDFIEDHYIERIRNIVNGLI
jgi:hypothetical protein